MSAADQKSNKKLVYVGGLSEEVTPDVLRSAFLPFGEVVDVQMPLDMKTRFGFVQFEEEEDAKASLDNMNRSEIYGRTITCNIAKPQKASTDKALWEDEGYLREKAAAEEKALQEEKKREAEVKARGSGNVVPVKNSK